jgi:hypothetical protein
MAAQACASLRSMGLEIEDDTGKGFIPLGVLCLDGLPSGNLT